MDGMGGSELKGVDWWFGVITIITIVTLLGNLV